MMTNNSITDELRKWGYGFCGSSYEIVNAIADHIDAEYKKAIRELNNLADASVLLPVDADGEPIRIGDEMECGDGTVFTVESITLYTFGWRCDGDGIDGNGYKCTAHPIPECCRHHKPTIEDMFMEFAYKILDPDQTDAISHRVKRYAKEYADKMHAIIEWSKGPEWQETASQDEGR